MRRPLHCLLVAVLIFSLSFDTARACWYLRHAHCGAAIHLSHACPPAPICPPGPVWHAGWSHAVVISDVAVGSGWHAEPCVETMVWEHGPWNTGEGVEEIACGSVVDCCVGTGDVALESAVAESSAVAAESAPVVTGPAPQTPVETPPAVAETPATPAPMPAEPVPAPAPIEPAPAAAGDQSVVTFAEPQPVDPAPAVQPASAAAPVTPPLPEAVAPDRETTPPAAVDTATGADALAEPIIQEPKPVESVAEQTPSPAAAPPAEPPAAEPAQPAAAADTADVQEPAPPAEEPAEPNLFEEVEATPVSAAPAETTPAAAPSATDAAVLEDNPAAPAEEPLPDEAAGAADAAPAADPEPAANDAPTESEEPVAEEPAAAEATEEAAPAADAAAKPRSSAEPVRRWIDATGRYAVVGTLLAVRETSIELRRLDGRTVSVPASRLSPHDQAYVRQAADRLLSGPTTPRSTDTAGM